MRVELKRLHKELGATIIYVTHDQIEAMTLATSIAVMRGGRIEQYAVPDTLYEQPETLFVAGFVGSPAMNFVTARLVGGPGLAALVGTTLIPLNGYQPRGPLHHERDVVVGVRPEHVVLADDAANAHAIEADTLFMEPMGADTLGWFQFGDQRISARLSPQRARAINGRVRLAFVLDHISLFDPTSEARL
jgi:multiple sugar transport system ATP-binding protein